MSSGLLIDRRPHCAGLHVKLLADFGGGHAVQQHFDGSAGLFVDFFQNHLPGLPHQEAFLLFFFDGIGPSGKVVERRIGQDETGLLAVVAIIHDPRKGHAPQPTAKGIAGLRLGKRVNRRERRPKHVLQYIPPILRRHVRFPAPVQDEPRIKLDDPPPRRFVPLLGTQDERGGSRAGKIRVVRSAGRRHTSSLPRRRL